METVNNNTNLNQQPQPQKEEEKKKNKVVAWWLGLGKWAKVGVCAGAAAVLATAITLPICLTKCGGNKTSLDGFSLETYDAFVQNKGDSKEISIITNPANVDISNGSIHISQIPNDLFKYTFDGKKIKIENINCTSETKYENCVVTLTFEGKNYTAPHYLEVRTQE